MTTLDNTYQEPVKKNYFTLSEIIWIFLVLIGSFYAWQQVGHLMDIYEEGILIGSAIALIFVGRFWHSLKMLSYWVAALSILAIWQYSNHGNQISANEENFFLTFLVSSQSAIMWMSALFVLGMISYFIALFAKSQYIAKIASTLTWAGVIFGLVGMMVRWRESYIINIEYII